MRAVKDAVLAFIGAQRRSLTGRAHGLSAEFPQEGQGKERRNGSRGLTDCTRSVPLSKPTVLVPGRNLLGLQPKRFHGLEPQVRGVSELSCSDEAERDQSALGSGHHLHSAEGGICLLGGDPRWVLSQSGGLGFGSHTSR